MIAWMIVLAILALFLLAYPDSRETDSQAEIRRRNERGSARW